MTLTIRPFTLDDYPSAIDLLNVVYPDYPDTVEELRFYDEHRDPKCRFDRWLAERDGTVVGIGQCGHAAGWYHPRKFWMDLSVHPDHQGRGVGSQLYQQLVDLILPLDPLLIRSGAREDKLHSVQFLLNRGFVEDVRSWESRLDVTGFDPTPFQDAERGLRAAGLEIMTLRELERDPERNQKLYELEWLLDQDVPQPEPPTRVSFEFFLEHTLQNPNLLPEAYLVAVDRTAYVGLSTLWSSRGNADLFTGLTGVRQEYRGRRIALALKLRSIAYARAHGHPVIRTWNESNNLRMLAINERLGFVKQPAWIDLVKTFQPSDGQAPNRPVELMGGVRHGSV
ncbi:MAG: GNAT family N-acetyltransferase [Chloroflexota bacterium]